MTRTPIEQVRDALADYLATPDSYPLIAPCPAMQDRLNAADADAMKRRFDDVEPEGAQQ